MDALAKTPWQLQQEAERQEHQQLKTTMIALRRLRLAERSAAVAAGLSKARSALYLWKDLDLAPHLPTKARRLFETEERGPSYKRPGYLNRRRW